MYEERDLMYRERKEGGGAEDLSQLIQTFLIEN
jgi:hypothetical protein